ncbi:MAG TPA: ABC transporter permease [Polyangiaceae bacterium]|jgi:hypothetical protein
MSAQTGTASIPPPPRSVRGAARARVAWARQFSDPNPVWMRELRQSARLTRTPIILAAVTGMMTLLICSVGGVASVSAEPARVGVGIFHTFFSLAFVVVTWVGPAVAAHTIAGERSGRTWEALQLTSLSPASIARGKFLAAYTYISLYVIMLAPVGVLPFLFGGITATEVLLAFVWLFLFAGLSVAFGLAVSSKFSSPAAAIIVTLLVALPASMFVFSAGGVGLSMVAHRAWPGIPEGPPVWLPGAYLRAEFGLPYLAFLVFLPLVLLALPAWLLYEVTVANMSAPSDDRSTRLRIWFLVSAPVLALTAIAVILGGKTDEWVYASTTFIWVFGCFAVFLFAGEPLGPSQRVLTHWERSGRGGLGRFLGPGLVRASVLLFLLTAFAMSLSGAVGSLVNTHPNERDALVAFHGYALAFFAFVVGFMVWARSRAHGAGTPRVLLVVALFFAFVGPWIAMAIAGVLSSTPDHALVLAAPSPTFTIAMISAIKTDAPERGALLLGGTACAAAWALIGAALLTLGSARAKKRLDEEAARHARMEAALAAEDAESHSGGEHAGPPPPSAEQVPETSG